MGEIKYSNTHINTTTHPNSLALKRLLIAQKPPTSITNPRVWWLAGSSTGKFSFALCTRFLRDVILVLHLISYFRYFSEEDIGSTNPHKNCRDCRNCKMQARLSRLQSPSQGNTPPSHHLLMLLFNTCYLTNCIIHVRLPRFPSQPFFF